MDIIKYEKLYIALLCNNRYKEADNEKDKTNSREESFWNIQSHNSTSLTGEHFIEWVPPNLPTELTTDKGPKWLIEMKETLSVRFIETQRLFPPIKSKRQSISYYDNQREAISTVTIYAQQLAETINKIHVDSSNLYQRLDRTFPSRAVALKAKDEKMDEKELRSKLTKLEEKRKYLTEIGVLDPSDPGDIPSSDQIDDSTNIILSVYVKDTEEKLKVFDDISKKIDLLKTIINKRFLYKDMTINRKDGITFTTQMVQFPLKDSLQENNMKSCYFMNSYSRLRQGHSFLLMSQKYHFILYGKSSFYRTLRR